MELSRASYHAAPGPVGVVGVGAATSVGTDAPMTAASVRAGLSGFRVSPLVDRAGEPMLWAMAPYLMPGLYGMDRLLALAGPAAAEAVAPLRAVFGDRMPALPVVIGLPALRPGLDDRIERELLSALETAAGLRFDPKERHVLALGHAAGLLALERGVGLLAARRAEWVLVGGVDSYRPAETLEWLDGTGRLHSEANPDGFVPGEGAGFCLLASEETARRYGLAPVAAVLAAVSAEEPYPFTSDGVCIGTGLTTALRDALAPLRGDERADWTLCDMNGESFRGTEWIYAYLRTGPSHGEPLALEHPVDCYGDVGAASGPVLMALAVQAWQRRYARGPRSLVWASSDGPARAAALLAAR